MVNDRGKPLPEEVNRLLEEGRQAGSLRLVDLERVLCDRDDLQPEEIQEILESLDGDGVQVDVEPAQAAPGGEDTEDLVGVYLRQMGRLPMLKREDERRLGLAIRRGAEA